jgi:hypothetical protein
MQILRVANPISFTEWLKLREDFGQGTGALGMSLPMKPKRGMRRSNLTSNPMFNINRGQSYQGTRRDDGNG